MSRIKSLIQPFSCSRYSLLKVRPPFREVVLKLSRIPAGECVHVGSAGITNTMVFYGGVIFFLMFNFIMNF